MFTITLLITLGSVAIVAATLGLLAAYVLRRTNSLKDLRYVAQVIRAFRGNKFR